MVTLRAQFFSWISTIESECICLANLPPFKKLSYVYFLDIVPNVNFLKWYFYIKVQNFSVSFRYIKYTFQSMTFQTTHDVVSVPSLPYSQYVLVNETAWIYCRWLWYQWVLSTHMSFKHFAGAIVGHSFQWPCINPEATFPRLQKAKSTRGTGVSALAPTCTISLARFFLRPALSLESLLSSPPLLTSSITSVRPALVSRLTLPFPAPSPLPFNKYIIDLFPPSCLLLLEDLKQHTGLKKVSCFSTLSLLFLQCSPSLSTCLNLAWP